MTETDKERGGGPSGERCSRCYYTELWSGVDEQPDPFFCRRYPPSDPCDDKMGGNLPPTVSPDSWCGEFKPKVQAP